jgi:hypothetical protein
MVAVMTDGPEASPDLKLVFTKEEWNAAVPGVTREMTKYLAGYRTPVFKDCGEYGDGWGSGSFVEVRGSKFILTNEHVAAPRRSGKNLGFQLANQETLVSVRGNHVEQAWPWDLALLPVSDAGWSDLKHSSDAIEAEQIALAHTPVPTEIFAFSGFAGEGASFNFILFFSKRRQALLVRWNCPRTLDGIAAFILAWTIARTLLRPSLATTACPLLLVLAVLPFGIPALSKPR